MKTAIALERSFVMGHKLASYGPIDDKIARELKSLDATLMAQVDAILRKQLHAMTFFNNLLEERMRSFRPSQETEVAYLRSSRRWGAGAWLSSLSTFNFCEPPVSVSTARVAPVLMPRSPNPMNDLTETV